MLWVIGYPQPPFACSKLTIKTLEQGYMFKINNKDTRTTTVTGWVISRANTTYVGHCSLILFRVENAFLFDINLSCIKYNFLKISTLCSKLFNQRGVSEDRRRIRTLLNN